MNNELKKNIMKEIDNMITRESVINLTPSFNSVSEKKKFYCVCCNRTMNDKSKQRKKLKWRKDLKYRKILK